MPHRLRRSFVKQSLEEGRFFPANPMEEALILSSEKIISRQVPYKGKGTLRIIRKNSSLYIMLLPGLVFFFVFSYLPMVFIIVAFQNYIAGVGVLGSPFVGLKNFQMLFHDPIFPQVIWNTVCINVMKLILIFPVPIALAIAFNEVKDSIGKRVMQTLVYMPHFFSWVVAYGLIIGLFSVSTGYVNQLIVNMGWQPIVFLGSKNYYWPFLALSEMWKESGWSSIIYIAAISGVNPEYYEAAIMDGANKFQQIWHITLSSIRGTVFVLFILSIGGLVSGSFEQILMTTNASLYDISEIIPLYVYHKGIVNYNVSFATAAGLFQSIISLILVVGTNYIAKKSGEYSIW